MGRGALCLNINGSNYKSYLLTYLPLLLHNAFSLRLFIFANRQRMASSSTPLPRLSFSWLFLQFKHCSEEKFAENKTRHRKKSSDLRCRLKEVSDVDEVTLDESATGNARSPVLEWRIDGTTSTMTYAESSDINLPANCCILRAHSV